MLGAGSWERLPHRPPPFLQGWSSLKYDYASMGLDFPGRQGPCPSEHNHTTCPSCDRLACVWAGLQQHADDYTRTRILI
ncbi:Uncharacterized protein HZ326_14965 [Fusarium oxysporum f. sp. albedinis]|nr:Uncharacterized protein HZ326_14965 [Fusarium oxysporum f. sp. albedinis]